MDFRDYSLGNQLWALFQRPEHRIEARPFATWPKWEEPGPYVKRREKALTLRFPVARTALPQSGNGTGQEPETRLRAFHLQGHWFVLAVAEGAEAGSSDKLSENAGARTPEGVPPCPNRCVSGGIYTADVLAGNVSSGNIMKLEELYDFRFLFAQPPARRP